MPTRREALKIIGITAGGILLAGCTDIPALTPTSPITPSPQPTQQPTATMPPTPKPTSTPQPTSTPRATAPADVKFFDDFSATKADWSGPTWSDATGKAVNTPDSGENLLTNADMESGDPPAGWAGMNRGVVKRVADPRPESAGTYALSVIRGTYNDSANQVTKSAVKNGDWFTLSGWSKSMGAASFASFYLHGTGYFTPRVGAESVNWGFNRTTGRCEAAGGGNVYLTVFGTGNEGRFDDMNLGKLTFPSLFRWLPATSVADLGLKCSWDLVTGPQCGVAARWDSASNPTSGIVAYYNALGGYKIFVDQCIKGSWSNLSAKTITPDSVHSLYLEVKGRTAKIYYNQTLLDTVTINGSLIENENNGLFSTTPEAKFSAFSLWKHRTTRMLVLGDAIANAVFGFGYQVPWAYPGLVTLSNRADVSAVFFPDGVHSGLEEQVAAAASDNADIVLINLGVNDGASPAAIQGVLEKQIGILKTSNPNAKIYMLGILPKTVDDNVQDPKRAAISAGCAAAGVTYWDTSDWIDPATDTGDGLHPNVRGHEKITKRIMALLPL